MSDLPQKLLLGLAVVLLLAGCAPASSPASGDRPSTQPAASDAKSILTALGVKEVSAPPAATVTTTLKTEVTVDPSAWHPLGQEYAVFSARAQIFQAGGWDGTAWNSSWADGPDAWKRANPFTNTDQTWQKTAAKTAVAADLDGDGLDEVAVFYVLPGDKTKLYCSVGKAGKFSVPAPVPGVTLTGKSFNTWTKGRAAIGTPFFPYFGATKASLKGNGTEQILVWENSQVFVLAVQNDGTVVLTESKDFSASGAAGTITTVSSVATGDMDGDRKSEIAVGLQAGGTQASYALYSGGLTKSLTSPAVQSLDSGGYFVEACFGDFNGTNLDQLVLADQAPNGQVQARLWTYDMANKTLQPVLKSGTPQVLMVTDNRIGDINGGSTDYYRMLPRAVNIDGTGRAQLQILGWLFADPLNSATGTNLFLLPNLFKSLGANTLGDVQVGDLDNDGKQDLVYLAIGQNGNTQIEVIGDSGGTWANKKIVLAADNANLSLGGQGEASLGVGAAIAVGNFTDNAARVRYKGHQLKFTDPIVIAALASPPYWSSVADADETYKGATPNWTTTYGTTDAKSTSTAHSVGFSVGASVEYEHEFDVPVLAIKVGKVTASWEFQNACTWEWSSSHEIAKSVTYSCNGGEDRVLFTSVPMDEYEYEIVATNDPVNNKVGKSVFISIPRAFQIYSVTREFYNAQIDRNVVPPIDVTVLGHTLGNPFTYPSAAPTGALTAPLQMVAEGSGNIAAGTTNMSISVSTGQEQSFSNDFSTEVSVGAGIGAVTVSAKAGFETGYTATTSLTTGTQFGGTVGYLPTSYYKNSNYQYQEGLIAYQQKLSNGKKLWVVTYRVIR